MPGGRTSGKDGGMTDVGGGVPQLLLGPLLRYVGETAVTVWAETDRACQVEILGRQARTFEVAGHHYALVVVDGLQPGTETEYQVTLDGTVCWPEPGSEFPPSVLRTLTPGLPVRLAFGSCRVAEMPLPQRRRERAQDEQEHGADALVAAANVLRETPTGSWPDALLMIGDQVYADEVGPVTRKRIEERRDPSVPPGDEVKDFTEYCWLYHETWSEPSVRWLLSVLPSMMIFDDHDVHDDWNISWAWRRDFQAKPWWRDRIGGAYMSYWIYQHLGNLSPEDLAKDEQWQQVQEPGDAAPMLSEFALRADAGPDGIQWTFQRTFGKVRVIVIDSRGGRVLSEDGKRQMVDDEEWQWVTESVSGDWDHVVLATSVPWLLAGGLHGLEAWNEAVCGGAWGKRFARTGEKIRRGADLEHWAAFGESFARFEKLLTGLATGVHGQPPASVTVISGDVHHSYLAQVEFPAGTNARSAVYQAVCSPIHNLLPEKFRRLQRLATSRVGAVIGTGLAWAAGVHRPRIRWQVKDGPWFRNMLTVLEYDGRDGRIRFDQSVSKVAGHPHLEQVGEAKLS